jgi:hypothetical protein
MSFCSLCREEKKLAEDGHVIPKQVYKRIKSNSPTGFLRSKATPNRRSQDGTKIKFLCSTCEDRFSKVETQFANKILDPYLNNLQTNFKYEEWLYYFICSISWRTLHFDLKIYQKTQDCPEPVYEMYQKTEALLRDYLMGRINQIEEIETHLIPYNNLEPIKSNLRKSQFMLRVHAFDYAVYFHPENNCYVIANLAGVLIITVIKKAKNEYWKNSLINPFGGEISGSPFTNSPAVLDFAEFIKENFRESNLSDYQLEKIKESLKKNKYHKTSKAYKFLTME